MVTHVLCINPAGELRALYADVLQPYIAGARIQRVSEVEYDHAHQGWTVRWAGTGVLMLPCTYPTRSEALQAEVAHLEQCAEIMS